MFITTFQQKKKKSSHSCAILISKIEGRKEKKKVAKRTR